MRTAQVAAAATIVGAAAHLVVAALSLGSAPIVSAVLFGMAAWCVGCGRELWRADTRRCWSRAALGSAAMLALHLGVMLLPAGHQHGVELGGLMTVAMATTIAAECFLVVGWLRTYPVGWQAR